MHRLNSNMLMKDNETPFETERIHIFYFEFMFN